MFRKDLVAKSLIWRFAIAIPVGTGITYFWVGSAADAIECSLFGNFIGTILYYTYDIVWDRYLQKFIKAD